MARSNSASKVPFQYVPSAFREIITDLEKKVDALSEGRISGFHNATTSMPSGFPVGTYAKGDFVKNTNPTETGVASSKYVIGGWVCIDATTSVGAFVEARTLTGN